jgi:hypothetical protein
MANIVHIGIDFSINSPSVCVETNGCDMRWLSLFNCDGKQWQKPNPTKEFKWHNKLIGLVRLAPYIRYKAGKNTDYIEEQQQKIKDAFALATHAVMQIRETIPCEEYEIATISLEGFAFGSKGNSFIDLIMYNSILREKLFHEFGGKVIFIIPPAQAKKLAYKGNANKEDMIRAFIKCEDETLRKTALWKMLAKEKNIDFNSIKPIDDLVDSYWIMRAGKNEWRRRLEAAIEHAKRHPRLFA